MTFAEQLKTLSVPELEKLKRILMLLAHDANHSFDELLAQIGAPQSALSQTDADLIDSRTYELEIYNHLDAASAHKQAMQEFEAGKLHEPKKPIPRYRPREQTDSAAATEGVGKANVAIGPALAATPANLPTRPATAPPQLPIEALPDNVFPLRLYSKFFHSGRDDDSVW
jgi:hypothetical protein